MKSLALFAGAMLFAVQCLAGATEWRFDKPGDNLGWQHNGHISAVSITNDALSFRATGPDPILEFRGALELQASPLQVVEIELRADQDGTAELFWSNTSTGTYGGFSQEKATRFRVQGDRQWRIYRLLPCWQREGKIVRLRFDVYDGAAFDLGCIRVTDLQFPQESLNRSEFNQADILATWKRFEPSNMGRSSMPASGTPQGTAEGGFLLAPPVRLSALSNCFVSVRMSASRGHHGTVFFATDNAYGLQSRSFPLTPDGREHTYNVDMLEARGWSGQILALGLQPSDDTNANTTVFGLKAAEEPQGPAQLRIASFAPETALPRVGLPAVLRAVVENVGAETATNVSVSLELPQGLELREGASPTRIIERLRFEDETSLEWPVVASRPIEAEARLMVSTASSGPVSSSTRMRFSPKLRVASGGHVPEPKPVRGPVEVGVYYFPGWKTASQWEPIRRFPERKPVLGWYREGDPEVADWHIKWAVEHGMTFFAYDWYWLQGARQLEHALQEGYFKARYRHLLKFCLLWANHNPPGSSSPEDCVAVTRHWIEHYFRRPEHLFFDGKPVMIIFAPDRLTEDLGSSRVKPTLEAMREECRRSGLKGLYLVACVGDAGGARRAAEEGYDSVTAYNWPGLGMSGESLVGPYATLIEGYRRQWDHIINESKVPLWPLPINGGWDSRPWHGDNNLVRFGRTPALFKQHLLDAKRLVSGQGPSGRLNAVLVEAWNEWGEGSYIEPHAEFGFGYLDAIREVFASAAAEHEDVTPADAALGPYDVPPSDFSVMAWDFRRPEQTWNAAMNLSDTRLADGHLSARTTGTDPAFFSPGIRARASDFDFVSVRMRLTGEGNFRPEDGAQLFWSSSRASESEASSARFPVSIDGEWHEYRIPVARNPRWRGVITRLRLDPVTQPGVNVELGTVSLSRKE